MNLTARRLTGAFGLVFVLALAGSLAAAAGAPGNDTGGFAVELYVVHHYHALQASVALAAVAVLFFSLFAGGLATQLRRADDAIGDAWAPGFVVGTAGTAVLLLGAVAVQGAYQEMSHSGSIPEQVQALFRVSNGLLAAAGLFLAVLLVTAGTSGLLNGTIPAPLAWFGMFSALVAVVSAGGLGSSRTTFGTLELVTLILFELWSLAVSLWLVIGPDPAIGPDRLTHEPGPSAGT